MAIISHENLSELLSLYGGVNINRLFEIVNNHIRVAIDEIKEDLEISNRVPHCSECEKCKSVVVVGSDTRYSCYKDANSSEYSEIVGNLGVDHPSKTSPKWCLKRKV